MYDILGYGTGELMAETSSDRPSSFSATLCRLEREEVFAVAPNLWLQISVWPQAELQHKRALR
jgi:hypothetical protein